MEIIELDFKNRIRGVVSGKLTVQKDIGGAKTGVSSAENVHVAKQRTCQKMVLHR